jgi:hypothetical protein
MCSLGRPPKKPLNLWGDATTSMITTPLNDRELDDAFVSGMAFLQNYSVEDIGGVDRVLQLAYDFAAKREAEMQSASSYNMPSAASIGARLRNSMWGSTPAPKPPPEPQEDTEDESEESEDEDEDEDKPLAPPPSQRATLGSRLANTVWKGITNQSAVEPPTTPDASPAPSPAPTQEKFPGSVSEETPAPQRTSTIWNYASKMRDSDTAATLAKVSTNWRVKAIDAWNKRNSGGATSAPSSANPDALSPSWIPTSVKHVSLDSPNIPDYRRGSFPDTGRPDDGYVPPARPAFFRPVRDSYMGDIRTDMLSPTGSDHSAFSENDTERYQQARANSLAALSRTSSPSSAKSGGPRPLLLGSSPVSAHSRSSTLPYNALDRQFADAVREKRASTSGRGSQSSVSSLSPQDQHAPLSQGRLPDAAGGSRIVRLNRTVSPMAMARAKRQESVSSAQSSPVPAHRRLPTDPPAIPEPFPVKSEPQTNARDSITTIDTIASPPPEPRTPENSIGGPRVVPSEAQRGSVVISEFGEVTDSVTPDVTPRRKGTKALTLQLDDSSDSSAAAPHRSARIRSKKYPSRLATLRSKHEAKQTSGDRVPSPNSLTAPEWHEEPEATTPKATSFEARAVSPVSRRPRKLSGDKGKKVSSERPERTRHKRESAAAEGDDEGYDELLSAYESEDVH